jgi:hypothetical protein
MVIHSFVGNNLYPYPSQTGMNEPQFTGSGVGKIYDPARIGMEPVVGSHNNRFSVSKVGYFKFSSQGKNITGSR